MANDSSEKLPDTSQWRNKYSAEAEHWNDLKRIGRVVVPTVLLLYIAIMAALAFVFLKMEAWSASGDTGSLGFAWFIFRIVIALLSPIVIAIVGIILLWRAVIGYAKVFYAQPELKNLSSLIRRRMLGSPPLPPPLNSLARYPFVVIKEPHDLKEDHWVRWLGGPATLVIYDGVAVYLERGGRFSRVVGPGSPPMPFLDRYETVKAVVDLRPQVKTGIMKWWSKDGIQIEVEIRMECQIHASESALGESQNLVYPFDPIAVKEAAEYTAVKCDDAGKLFESDWLDGIWGQVTGHLARHISGHSVDEIALSELQGVGQSEGDLHTFQLARQHLDTINKDLTSRKCGVRVTNIHLQMKFPDPVEKKRIEYWKSERERLAIIRSSIAEADGIRVRQEARANAERDVLNAIIERLRRVDPANLTEPLLLSLTSILDRSLDNPLVRPLIAKNSINLLEKLREVLREGF